MRQNSVLNFIPGTDTQTQLQLLHRNVCCKIMLVIKKNRYTTPTQNHNSFIVPRPKGVGNCHKSGTGKIGVGNEQLPVINSALIARTLTQRGMSCRFR